MEILDLTRWIHGGLGAICLVAGLIALIVPKKAGKHSQSGKVFVAVLCLLYLAILPNIFAKNNIFMFVIGWIAIAAAAEGWRALLRFKKKIDTAPNKVDYIVHGLSLIMGLVLILYGGWIMYQSHNFMGVALLFFGWLGIALSHGAYKRWQGDLTPQEWLQIHIHLMSGAFSAAVTAFVALQFSGKVGSFEWVLWVAPTVFMTQFAKREANQYSSSKKS